MHFAVDLQAAKNTFSWYFPSTLLGTDRTVWSCPWTGNETQAHSDPDVKYSVTCKNCSALCFHLKTRLAYINVSETLLACSKLTQLSTLISSKPIPTLHAVHTCRDLERPLHYGDWGFTRTSTFSDGTTAAEKSPSSWQRTPPRTGPGSFRPSPPCRGFTPRSG